MRFQESWSRDASVSETSQTQLEDTVGRALAIGVNHFETARGYGTSEAQLGRALAKHPRDKFVLQTKIHPPVNPGVFEKYLEESFRGLRVERVDLFSFHGINTPDCLSRVLRPGGYMEVVESLRRQGRIGHVGFSTHAPTRLIVEAIETGKFDYVNLHYYYIFQDNRPALEAAHKQDMGVFIISPTDKGGKLQEPSDRMRELCRPLSPMVFNNLWCLNHPEIHTLSLGAARPSDFDEHLLSLPLLDAPEDHLAPVVVRLEEAYRTAVGSDFATRWQEGLLGWEAMPGKINVKKILWLLNLVRAYDLVDFAKDRYAILDPNNHWTPGARYSEADDAAIVAALPDSPFRHEIPAMLRQAHRCLSP